MPSPRERSRRARLGETRIKLGFDAHVLEGRHQGSSTVIRRLASRLAAEQADIEVRLYAAADVAAGSGTAVKFRRIPPSGKVARLLRWLPRAIILDDLDAMIFQYVVPPFGRKNWVVMHDILPITHPRLFSLPFIIRSAALFFYSMLCARRIIAVSHYTAAELERCFPFMRGKVEVVRNGPSFDEAVYFAKPALPVLSPVPEGCRYVLAVGRLERRKNIDLLVKAFRLAAAPGVKLVIVGKEEPQYRLRPDCEEVIRVEAANEDLLISLYARAALFVYPSSAEGFGLPLLDAVLFGIPTLSSDRTSMPEVGGDLAEYFNPTDAQAVEQLAARIAGHFSDRPVHTPSLNQRYAHALAFSWSSSADRLADLLRAHIK